MAKFLDRWILCLKSILIDGCSVWHSLLVLNYKYCVSVYDKNRPLFKCRLFCWLPSCFTTGSLETSTLNWLNVSTKLAAKKECLYVLGQNELDACVHTHTWTKRVTVGAQQMAFVLHNAFFPFCIEWMMMASNLIFLLHFLSCNLAWSRAWVKLRNNMMKILRCNSP